MGHFTHSPLCHVLSKHFRLSSFLKPPVFYLTKRPPWLSASPSGANRIAKAAQQQAHQRPFARRSVTKRPVFLYHFSLKWPFFAPLLQRLRPDHNILQSPFPHPFSYLFTYQHFTQNTKIPAYLRSILHSFANTRF